MAVKRGAWMMIIYRISLISSLLLGGCPCTCNTMVLSLGGLGIAMHIEFNEACNLFILICTGGEGSEALIFRAAAHGNKEQTWTAYRVSSSWWRKGAFREAQ